MSRYVATIEWKRADAAFVDNTYSRAHEWRFDGGAVVRASSSPSVVPVPHSDPTAVDPEEAFVAALSSCHMLFFLAFAAKRGYVVDGYRDEALGVMGSDAEGRMAMTEVVLRPEVVFVGRTPDEREHASLHERSHDACFIANSVKADVRVEPSMRQGVR
ncbi:MAG TPA: OsmC family protein [Casimicrobiaceae bacterium]|nr:OsmC family protein [Casimicrobiaceae bacterium]